MGDAEEERSLKPYEYMSPLPPFEYHRPTVLRQALECLDQERDNCRLLAGGTDLLIELKKRNLRPRSIVDITSLEEMNHVKVEKDFIEVGPLTTFSELERSEVIRRHATCLYDASRRIGTPQLRNLATIGGNLATASPAADSAPPLLVLDGSVEVTSLHDDRKLGISELFAGVKKTVLRPDELIAKIFIPIAPDLVTSWDRVANRRLNICSTVSAASGIQLDGNVFARVRIALGAVAPTPMLATHASEFLMGKQANMENIERAAQIAANEARPITDIRASAEYRKDMIRFVTRRTLSECVLRASKGVKNGKWHEQ